MSPEKQLQKTAQGYEMHIGVNCLGNFLFTKLLTPTIIATAKTEPANTVRVIWVCSYATELFAVKNIGLPLDNLDFHNLIPGNDRYATSKVGNWAHGVEYAKRYKSEGIISIPLNPGNLTSELFRDQVFPFSWVARMLGYPPVNGAYTELFAGLSPDITLDTTGNWGEL
jgi:NAD(P)-dependent dehydrogenase (short-subunit alcohol dehydrogenase family)